MESITIVFLVVAIVLQVMAVALALRLAPIARTWGARWGWALIPVGLILMVMRRLLALVDIFVPSLLEGSREPLVEGIGAAISACMVLGVLVLSWHLTRVEAASRRQREELATVYRVGLVTTSTLALDSLLQQIYDQVHQLVSFDLFYVALYDEASDELRLELIVEDGRVQPKLAVQVGEGGGFGGWIIRSRQALRIGDVEAEQDRLPAAPRLAGARPRSWLGLPLIAKDRVVGVLSVQSYRPNAFTADDERLLTIIAAQAAIAIENARLYKAEREQHELAETLRQVGATLVATLDLDIVLDRLLEQLGRVVPNDVANVMLIEGDHTYVARWRGYERFGVEAFITGVTYPVASIPTFRRMLETGEPLSIADTQANPDWLPKPGMEWLRSYVGAPIRVRDKVIGFLNVDSVTPSFFGPSHAERLRAFADQAAIAIENARLYRSVQASEARYRTLIETANDWIWMLDAQGQFTFFNRQAEEASGHKLKDWLGKSFVPLIAPDDLPRVRQVFVETLAGQPQSYEVSVFDARGQTIVLSVNTAPIIEEGQVVGTVSFGRDVTDHKKAERKLDRSNRELAALNAIAATVSQSLDLAEILGDALDKTQEVMQLEARGGIFLLDEEANMLRLTARRGLPPEFVECEASVQVGECLCGRVAETGELLCVDAASVNARHTRPDRGEPHGHLIVPLKSKGKVLGVMFLYPSVTYRANDQDVRLLTAIGNQIGVGIENAQLYEHSRAQADDLELLYEVGRLFTSSLDPQQVLSDVARRCMEVFEADLCLVRLVEADLLAVRGSFYRDDAERAKVEALLSANPIRVGEGIAGRVAATGQPALSTGIDPAQVTLPGYVDYLRSREWLLVPMRIKDRSLGVLTLIARRERRCFSQHDVALAQEVANQAAAALENARLYQEATRRLEEVSLIRAVALAGAASRPFDDIVADATQQLQHLWASHSLGFLFPDETGDTLRPHSSYLGLSDEARHNFRFRPGQGITGWALQTGKPVLVPDVWHDPRYIEGTPETRSEMAAPLVVGERVIGVINVASTRLDAFTSDDVHLLSALAGQLAIILDNVQTHRDLANRARRLQEAYADLAEAERLKNEMVQNVSHELRTPLTFLKGYIELMRDETFGLLPPGLREPLVIVSEKTAIVERLVERITSLQVVCPETLALELLSLTVLVQEAQERWALQAQRAGVEMESDLLVDLSMVAGDRHLLSEALDNLLSNAIKFSPTGGRVTVRVRGEGELVHAEISDTGIGIPPDKLSRIFDRFYQVDGTPSRRFGGAGVGLALVRQIVEAHGGRVWVESQVGQGSTFYMMLPIAPAHLDPRIGANEYEKAG